MSRSLLFSSVALLAVLVGLAVADDPSVQPTQVVETRVRQLVKGDQPAWDAPDLMVHLRITGRDIKLAKMAEPPTITEAKDDTGADLMPPKDDLSRDEHAPFLMGIGERDDPKDAVDVPLHLKVPARNAKSIATLKGQVTLLAGGQEKAVSTADLAKLADKDIDSADLKAAGITVRIVGVEAEGKKLKLRVSGAVQAIKSGDVLDGGESIVQGTGVTTDEKGNTETTYDLSKPLDAKTTLKIAVIVGQKKLVVPFALKGIELP